MAEETQPLYKPILITKDKNIQTYLEQNCLQLYIPFISHFCVNPGLMKHYKTTKTSIFERFRDFGRISLRDEHEDEDILAEQHMAED